MHLLSRRLQRLATARLNGRYSAMTATTLPYTHRIMPIAITGQTLQRHYTNLSTDQQDVPTNTDELKDTNTLDTAVNEKDTLEDKLNSNSNDTTVTEEAQLIQDPLSEETIQLMDTLQERPVRANLNDITNLKPKNMDRLTDKQRKELQTTLEQGFTANQLKMYLLSLKLSISGSKRKLTDRMIEYWSKEAAKKRAIHLKNMYDASTVKGRIFYEDMDSDAILEKQEHLITREAIQLMDTYDPMLLDRVRSNDVRVDIDRDSNMLYIAGTEAQVTASIKQLKPIMTPAIDTIHLPASTTAAHLSSDRLSRLGTMTSVIINPLDESKDGDQSFQLICSNKRDLNMAASAIEQMVTVNDATTTYLYKLPTTDNGSNSHSDYNLTLLPFHDTLSMPLLPRYSAPFRVIDPTPIDITTKEAQYSRNTQLASAIVPIKNDSGQDAVNINNLSTLITSIEQSAQQAIDQGFKVSGQAVFGYSYFYNINRFGISDALHLPNKHILSPEELGAMVSSGSTLDTQYRTAFLPNYSISHITGQLQDMVQPRQCIELEYVVPTSIFNGIKVQLTVDSSGNYMIEGLQQFTRPFNLQLLVPTGQSDLLIQLDATKSLSVSEQLSNQLIPCKSTSPINSIPTRLENFLLTTLKSSLEGQTSTIADYASLRLNAIRRISEQQRKWHDLLLQTRRVDELRQGISLYQSILSTNTPLMALSNDHSDTSAIHALLVEALCMVHES
ncbi:hypothetical protein BDF19DRAFT_440629 [Syncephalis fuscata]|nr:hypothetical protein BDF19DRAFT_440629 [Syncephalis fuscata]